jgi:hypothetical protein
MVRRNADDPSALGWLVYRLIHYPIRQLRLGNPDFWLFLLLQRVRGGPFVGMRYVGESPSPQIGPCLLGMNELEIWPFIERQRSGNFDVFVNVGAAEGYYAVGMARGHAFPRVISYEGNRLGRVLTRVMATRNGVTAKLDVRGSCDPDALAATLSEYERPALLLDVEGYEETLADPVRVPQLRRTNMIIELHEHERPMADILRLRFEATHTIEEIWTRPRTAADLPASLWPATVFFSRKRLLQLGTEGRVSAMRWWLMSPKLQ